MKEKNLGRVAGPFESPPFEDFICSPLGIIPKKDPGEFWLIHNLSAPKRQSVNEAIDGSFCSVKNASLDHAITMLQELGPGTLLAKADVESAFSLLLVHPEEFHLLGFQFEGAFYFDKCIPMGCSVSCAYFEKFSTFLKWAFRKRSGHHWALHYLYDFLFLGAPGTDDCGKALQCFQELMGILGVPLAQAKTCGPATTIEFLGIELDSEAGVSRLPQDKVRGLSKVLEVCLRAQKVTLHQLQVVVGQLNFALRIVPKGRPFSKSIAWAMVGLKSKHHHTSLSSEVRQDMRIWQAFLKDFNGSVVWPSPARTNAELGLWTDAAGSTGFGSILGPDWCAERWPSEWRESGLVANIGFLELFPILVALTI